MSAATTALVATCLRVSRAERAIIALLHTCVVRRVTLQWLCCFSPDSVALPWPLSFPACSQALLHTYRARKQEVHAAVRDLGAGFFLSKRDQSAAAVGYVGLLNQGATCYMNSLLQVGRAARHKRLPSLPASPCLLPAPVPSAL